MAIHVLAFDPMKIQEIQTFEQELDSYLSTGWEVLSAISGNRPGIAEGKGSFRSAKVLSPEYRDYIVFVLRNAALPQEVKA
jgi:hypothetical protein